MQTAHLNQYAIGQPRVLYQYNRYLHIKGLCHCTHLTSAKRPDPGGSTQEVGQKNTPIGSNDNVLLDKIASRNALCVFIYA